MYISPIIYSPIIVSGFDLYTLCIRWFRIDQMSGSCDVFGVLNSGFAQNDRPSIGW